MKALLAVLCLAFLAACQASPISESKTDNTEVKVGLLFTHEGCRVYRFYDGNAHYYVVCGRDAVTTLEGHTESCGKNCTRRVESETPTVLARF